MGFVDVSHGLGHPVESISSGGAEQTKELLQIDLSVTVDVSEDEDGINLRIVELPAASYFLPADVSILIDINAYKCFLDFINVVEFLSNS